MPRQVLIVGCGYVGLPLALQMQARGDDVTGWVRSETSAAELLENGIKRVVVGSVSDAGCWTGLPDFDQVVHCAATGGGGVTAYQRVFLEGTHFINSYQARAQRLLISSTSVYGQIDGGWVDEYSVAEPTSETSQVLRAAEDVILHDGGNVIRSAGIYGPRRAALFEKFRRGEAIMEGDGTRWINQIHRIDLIAGILDVLEIKGSGQIYNLADNEPVALRDYYAWCSDALHLPLPPYGPVNTRRKRGVTNKRVDNRKMRDTGWKPHFPSFREGLTERIKAEGDSQGRLFA